MPSRKLTIRLPEEDIEFAKNFASQHGVTLTELVDVYFKGLRTRQTGTTLHPDILRFTGIIPEDINEREEYLNGQEDKHQ